MHICLCPGLWPWSGSGAKHKVNEVENMLGPGGCQAQGRGVPACHSPPWTQRVGGGGAVETVSGYWKLKRREVLQGSLQAPSALCVHLNTADILDERQRRCLLCRSKCCIFVKTISPTARGATFIFTPVFLTIFIQILAKIITNFGFARGPKTCPLLMECDKASANCCPPKQQ